MTWGTTRWMVASDKLPAAPQQKQVGATTQPAVHLELFSGMASTLRSLDWRSRFAELLVEKDTARVRGNKNDEPRCGMTGHAEICRHML